MWIDVEYWLWDTRKQCWVVDMAVLNWLKWLHSLIISYHCISDNDTQWYCRAYIIMSSNWLFIYLVLNVNSTCYVYICQAAKHHVTTVACPNSKLVHRYDVYSSTAISHIIIRWNYFRHLDDQQFFWNNIHILQELINLFLRKTKKTVEIKILISLVFFNKNILVHYNFRFIKIL